MKIGCKVELKLDGEITTAEEIFKKIFNIEKHDVDYKDGLIYHMEFKGDKLVNKFIDLEDENSAFKDVTGSGIYFIFKEDATKVLYIGKDKNLNQRLKQHLWKCSASTNSHIDDVIDYLKSKTASKKLRLKYCILNTEDDNCNAAIEGALIDYMMNNGGDARFNDCWNKRRD